MTIKSKISFYVSIFSTLLFGVVCVSIIMLFSRFRKQEFEARLNEKALTAIKLLIDVKEVDNNLLKIIDQNTINELYNEKILIFDARKKLLYSSLDDTKVNWREDDLSYLKERKTFFKKDGENEIYGLFYNAGNEEYFIIISADDNYGKRKLNFLIYILIGAYILFVVATWFFTFAIIKEQFIPLGVFHKKVRNINDLNSESKLELDTESNNEIDLLSNEFNHMMERISDVYQKQREFTAQASHELRTPLARIMAQVENQMQHANAKDLSLLQTMAENIGQLKELINSLLILSRIDNQKVKPDETARIDEVIYNCIEKISFQHPALKVNFTINAEIENLEELLEVNCNQSLLEIAFGNLLKNAYLYADDKSVDIEVTSENNQLIVHFCNSGKLLSGDESQQLFLPFTRGQNAKETSGLGLGLRIVQRIMNTYNFSISYNFKNGKHVFTTFH